MKQRLRTLSDADMQHESALDPSPRLATRRLSVGSVVDLRAPALSAPTCDAPEGSRAGQSISERVLALPAFQQSQHIGIYVHAPSLREVDTTLLISSALAAGTRTAGCCLRWMSQVDVLGT